MLHRCRARASERGLTSLAAGASLELARRLVYRRRGVGDDDAMDEYGGGFGSNQEEAAGRGSLAWTSIQSAGRMPSSMVGSSSTAGHGGRGASSAGASDGMVVAQAPTDIYNMTNTEALGILGRQNIAIAGLWESTGHESLASLSSCAALYGAGGPNLGGGEDMTPTCTAMITRVLSSFTNGPGLDVWVRDNSRDGVAGLNHPNAGGESMPKAIGKIYATILDNLVSLSEGKGQPPSLYHSTALNNNNHSEWIFSAAASFTLHEWAVRSYDLSIARGLHTLLANYAAFPSSNGGGGGTALPAVEASLAFLSRSIHLYLQREEYDRAKVFARRACWLASRHSLTFHQGWHLLQLALIDAEAASTSSSSSVEHILPPLLECLDLSERYSMDPLRALALATVAKVLLCMGRYQKARAMLRAAMPLVMQNGHVWFLGETFLTSAKCYLAEARSRESGEPAPQRLNALDGSVGDDDGIAESSYSGKRKRQQKQKRQQHDSSTLELRETALSELKQAAFHFMQIEDLRRLRQVYYLQARTCHSLPSTSSWKNERDEAARIFAQLSGMKRERAANSIMYASSSGSNILIDIKANQQKTRSDSGPLQQSDVLRGVVITDSKEMKRCVSMMLRR